MAHSWCRSDWSLTQDTEGKHISLQSPAFFFKWPEAIALPDKIATGVAEFLYKCCWHGCCKVKISDQGREFVNQVRAELYFMLCYIDHVHCT